MSDIQLNIGGYSSDSDGNTNFVSKKQLPKGKKFQSGPTSNTFSFEFTKKSNVKALVARKKGPLRTVGDEQRSSSKSAAGKPTVGDGIRNVKSASEFKPKTVKKHVTDEKSSNMDESKVSIKPKFTAESPPKQKNKSLLNKKVAVEDEQQHDEIVTDEISKSKGESKPKLPAASPPPNHIRIGGKKFRTRDAAVIVQNIFNPERQKRIEALKHTINNDAVDKPQAHTYTEHPEREKQRKNVTKHQHKEAPLVGQRFVNPITEKVFSGAPLTSLNFHAHAVKNLQDLFAINELTLVQQKTIPKILEGHDVLVRAQTGSGKTLAYALPIVEKMHNIRPKLTRNCGIQALIVVPTRELAIQSYDVLIKLLKPYTWIVPGYLSGGEKRKSEKARLRKGINILVGTPGRLLDHLLNTESLKFDKMKWLVLDEADRLFELGYEKDVSKIIEAINKKVANAVHDESTAMEPGESEHNKPQNNKIRFGDGEADGVTMKKLQSILLSATLTPAVEKLAGLALKSPIYIDNAETETNRKKQAYDNLDESLQLESTDKLVIPSTVILNYVIVPPKLRFIALSGLLVKECNKTSKKILVFVATQELVDFHHDTMTELLTKNILDEDDESSEEEREGATESSETVLGILKGVRFFRLHGSMSQVERSSIFKAFCATKSGILLTTDVAARGLDVPEVDLVVHYTPPQLLSDFVHRVGRTARAGRKGRSIVFVSDTETDYIRILEEKRIRISQVKYQPCLDILLEVSDQAKTVQDAIYDLQRRYEHMVADDEEMHEKAGRAFSSWVRYYSSFPKEMKHIFNIRVAHMGHYAKSFGFKEPPTFMLKKHNAPKVKAPSNRLSYRNKDDDKKAKKRKYNENAPYAPKKQNARTICLTTSEYDSGMPAKKRKH